MFQPLTSLDDPSLQAQSSDKPGLMVEKTSRSMAQQLKQMEENRKKKAIEDEMHKKEQLKLQKVQALIDSLKGTREFLYKLGNKA